MPPIRGSFVSFQSLFVRADECTSLGIELRRQTIAALGSMAEHGSPVTQPIDELGILLVDQNQTSHLESLFKAGIEDVIALGENIDLLIIKMRIIRDQLLEREKRAAEYAQSETSTSGTLSDTNLVDILRRINEQLGTAKLTVTRADSGGENLVICIDRGEPIFAGCGSVLGREALYNALSWVEGSWTVDPIKQDVVQRRSMG